MIIKDGMNIKIRTEEERDVFVEVANKEGHKWRGGHTVRAVDIYVPSAISIGYRADDNYPKDISRDGVEFCGGRATNVVEASQLFRNQLISKRLKE